MRGPGQAVDVPATAQGLPVTFQSPGNVSSLVFTVGYNPVYLTITGATAGANLPAGATISSDLTQAGLARFTIVSPNTPLAAGKLNLLNLTAKVPESARYGAKEIIDLTLLNVNGNVITKAWTTMPCTSSATSAMPAATPNTPRWTSNASSAWW